MDIEFEMQTFDFEDSEGESVEFRRQTRQLRTNLELSLKENSILQDKLMQFQIDKKRQDEEQLRMQNDIATLSMVNANTFLETLITMMSCFEMLEDKVSSAHGAAIYTHPLNPTADRLRNLTTSRLISFFLYSHLFIEIHD